MFPSLAVWRKIVAETNFFQRHFCGGNNVSEFAHVFPMFPAQETLIHTCLYDEQVFLDNFFESAGRGN